MDRVCPVCNSLEKVDENCPNCGCMLEDGGSVQSYLGPYSPYMESELIPLHMADSCCIHLVYCSHCQYETKVAIQFVTI